MRGSQIVVTAAGCRGAVRIATSRRTCNDLVVCQFVMSGSGPEPACLEDQFSGGCSVRQGGQIALGGRITRLTEGLPFCHSEVAAVGDLRSAAVARSGDRPQRGAGKGRIARQMACFAIVTCILWAMAAQGRADGDFPTIMFPLYDSAVVAEWVPDPPRKIAPPAKPDEIKGKMTSTKQTYRIVRVIKAPNEGEVSVGKELIVQTRFPARAKRPVILVGDANAMLPNQWLPVDEYTPEMLKFLQEFPGSKEELVDHVPTEAQAVYLLKFLEHAEPAIANEAFSRMTSVPPKRLIAMASDMPRKKLLKWIVEPAISGERKNLYGVMLGLCGRKADAPVLERIIRETKVDENWWSTLR